MYSTFKVMVRCVSMRQDFDTGIRTSGREVLDSAIYDGKVACHICGQSHLLRDNAFLVVDEFLPGDALWRPNA